MLASGVLVGLKHRSTLKMRSSLRIVVKLRLLYTQFEFESIRDNIKILKVRMGHLIYEGELKGLCA